MKTEIVNADQPNAVFKAVQLIQNGDLVAFPTDTVYGLGAVSYTHLTLPTTPYV